MDVLSVRFLATDPGSRHIISLTEQFVQRNIIFAVHAILYWVNAKKCYQGTMGNAPRIEHHIMYAVSDLIYLFALKTNIIWLKSKNVIIYICICTYTYVSFFIHVFIYLFVCKGLVFICGLDATEEASPTWCWICWLAQSLNQISTSYSSFFHVNSCWIESLLSRHEKFQEPKGEIDKCGASPTYLLENLGEPLYSTRPETWNSSQLHFFSCNLSSLTRKVVFLHGFGIRLLSICSLDVLRIYFDRFWHGKNIFKQYVFDFNIRGKLRNPIAGNILMRFYKGSSWILKWKIVVYSVKVQLWLFRGKLLSLMLNTPLEFNYETASYLFAHTYAYAVATS